MELNFDLTYGKCFEVLRSKITDPVVICGYGVYAKQFMGLLAENNVKVLAVCDKNKVGQNYEYLTNGTIESYHVLSLIKEKFQVVIPSENYFKEIKQEVMQYVAEDMILDVKHIKDIYMSIPKCFELREPYIYKRYIQTNMEKLDRIIEHLRDELSIKILENVIKSRLTWNESYVRDLCVGDMYFIPELQLGNSETFLDAGAYDGDTAVAFINAVDKKFNKIYCVEPNEKKYECLNSILEQYGADKIEIMQKGLSSKKGELCFAGGERNFYVSAGGETKVEITTIDALGINPSFIKLDIQGEELNALMGGINTIKNQRPKLAVCVYHKMEDIIDIGTWILDLNMDYKLFIRHHAEDINDTVLYAV